MTDHPAPPALPPAKGGVVAYLNMQNSLEAAKFYEKALGAETAYFFPPDAQGRTMHVHLYINDASVMLGDAYPEQGHPYTQPSGYMLQLTVDDADAWVKRAVAAGCKAVMPVQDMFWGDRWGTVADPYGVTWGFNQPLARRA